MATNPSAEERKQEVLVLKISAIKAKIGNVPKTLEAIVFDEKAHQLPTQTEDLDLDGKPDQIAFLADFAPKTTRKFTLRFSNTLAIKKQPTLTHAHLGVSEGRNGKFEAKTHEVRPMWWMPQAQPPRYQCEGPCWENDKVAFRAYLDSRAGLDIFGKTTPNMVTDSIGLGQDYHKLQPWGMDILKVGSSLGAGGLAIKYKDSLYRVGATGGEVFDVVADGPVRAVVRLHYYDQQLAADTCQVIQHIYIKPGVYAYESTATLVGAPKEAALATGLVTLKLTGAKPEIPQGNYSSIISFGKQSENEDDLGMALLANGKMDVFDVGAKPYGIGTTMGFVAPQGQQALSYAFIAGWSRSDQQFTTADGFTKYVKKYQEKMSPISVTLQ